MNRLNPDSRPVLVTAVLLTSLLGAVSFALSYAGLVAVAAWAAVPPSLAWAVPVTIDGAILVYTLAVLVFRARGESTAASWAGLGLFTAVSVFANGAHAWEAGAGDARAVIGTGIAGLAPIAVLLATHTIADLVIARPEPSTTAAASEGSEPVPFAAPVLAFASEFRGVPERLVLGAEEPSPKVTLPVPPRTRRPASPERDAAVRALAAEEGLSVRAIAERLGIGKSTVARILAAPVAEEVTA